jgi:hypothetical protein
MVQISAFYSKMRQKVPNSREPEPRPTNYCLMFNCMPHCKRLKLRLFVGLLLLSCSVSAQNFLEIPVKLEVEKGDLSEVVVKVKKDGKDAFTQSGASKMRFKLDFNKKYTLIFTKPGYITKTIEVNTNAPAARIGNGFEPYKIGVKLFLQNEENMVVYNQPVAQIKYDQNLDEFNFDTDYSKSILSAISRDSNEETPPAPAPPAPEPVKPVVAAETAPAPVTPAPTPAAESQKAAAPATAMEQQPTSAPVTKAEEQIPPAPVVKEEAAPAPPPPAPKVETPPAPVTRMEEAPPVAAVAPGKDSTTKTAKNNSGDETHQGGKAGSGEEAEKKARIGNSGEEEEKKARMGNSGEETQRRLAAQRIAEETERKLAAARAGSEDMNAGPGAMESEKVTREDIVEKNRVITKIKVVKNGIAVEYSRVNYSWGGQFFFKNTTQSISENLFVQWTGVNN